MPLSDFARTDVVTAAPTTSVGDVSAAMRERDVSLVALLEESRPVGLLTAADIGRAYVAGENLDDRAADDVLAEEPLVVSASADLSTLVSEFRDTGQRHAMLVDADGVFEGVVTLGDALVQYGRDLETVLSLFDG